MKYLFMVVVDEKRLQAMSETEAQTLDDESLEYDDALRKGGHFLAAQALESVNTATTVRIRSGKVSITDGPFAETKEQIGGFILIEAKDLDEAIQLASHIPAIRLGAVEVRPIKELVHSSRQRELLRNRGGNVNAVYCAGSRKAFAKIPHLPEAPSSMTIIAIAVSFRIESFQQIRSPADFLRL